METTMLKVSQIQCNNGQIEGLPANPRQITQQKLALLKQSISESPEMLHLRELLVYPFGNKYVVIGGNMRYRAAIELGIKELPCKIIDPATPIAKLREYTIKDNNGYGAYDWDMLANEWDDVPLLDWGVDMPDFEEADSEEENTTVEEDDFDKETDTVVCRCQRGDIWQLGKHRVMCGDSTSEEDINRLRGGELADLWITDPPYNVGYEGGTADKLTIQNDKMGSSEFRGFLSKAFKVASTSLKLGGAFYVWFASKEHINFETALEEAGLRVRQEIIWAKNTFTLGRQDYQWKHEPCLYGWKDGAPHYFVDDRTLATIYEDSKTIDFNKLKKHELLEYIKDITKPTMPTSIINENKPVRNAEHPTMKPVKLIGYLVKNSSKIEDVVLDNFGGSGTTLIACEQLGRKCLMMELDPHYCDVIMARWEKLTGLTAVKITEHNG